MELRRIAADVGTEATIEGIEVEGEHLVCWIDGGTVARYRYSGVR